MEEFPLRQLFPKWVGRLSVGQQRSPYLDLLDGPRLKPPDSLDGGWVASWGVAGFVATPSRRLS